MMSTSYWRTRRYRAGADPEDLEDRVVMELPLEIRVNGVPTVALMRLPGLDKELAVGFCLTEKVVDDVSRINLLKHCGQMEDKLREGEQVEGDGLDKGNLVEIEVESPGDKGRFTSTFVVRTGCGGADLSAVEDYHEGMVTSETAVREEVIYGLGEALTGGQEIFRGTGGTHGAGVFTPEGEVVVVAEDVGRHNALDKAVGWCALRDIPLEDKILVLSGRISYEMALKAVRVGIPVLVSLSAPTSLGLRIAEKAGLTVVGFSDGERFNVYTHLGRIQP